MVNQARDVQIDLREDRPGTLARVLEAVALAGLNVDGYAEIEGVLHLLTSDSAAAQQAIDGAGFGVRTEEVLTVDLGDRPGTLAAVLRRIANAGLNLRFLYLASRNRAVIGSSDPQAAVEVLRGADWA